MLGTVEKLSEEKFTICLDSDKGENPRRVIIEPRSYDAFDHGYATTIHKSQGATVDHAYVLAPTTMDRHMTYVALTRYRQDMHLYGDESSIRKLKRSEDSRDERTLKQFRKSTPTRKR